MLDYHQFLETKSVANQPTGFEPVKLHDSLFDWQRDIVRLACRRGCAALFEDCGLGKTIQQLVWSNEVVTHTDGDVVILAPLMVANQTVAEGARFGIEVTHALDSSQVKPGINITNYERLHKFDLRRFKGVVLDESSILKAYMGETKQQIIESFRDTPYKLACTATPAPNDFMELGNHCEFLGVMRSSEMLAAFFINDSSNVGKYRIKGHAEDECWRWMASWAICMKKPSDLGYSDEGFTLPPIHFHEHVVQSRPLEAGLLFAMPAVTLKERRDARRASLSERVDRAVEIANSTDEQVIVWCDLNNESVNLAKLIKGAIEVTGSQSDEVKTERLLGFCSGKHRVLVSKPSICGFGMNLQHCCWEIFVGLSDSYERFYQAVRRCWRFGQKREVHAHVVTADTEGAVVANIHRKEKQAAQMSDGMVKHMAYISRGELQQSNQFKQKYKPQFETQLASWL